CTAPERTETSKGSTASPNFLFIFSSSLSNASIIFSSTVLGILFPATEEKQMMEALDKLEEKINKKLGDVVDPLLVSFALLLYSGFYFLLRNMYCMLPFSS